MIAGAESTIAGAELSIGGGGEGEGHPKSMQIDTNVSDCPFLFECVLCCCFFFENTDVISTDI